MIEGYKKLLKEKRVNGRLPNVDLLIPNVEGRLGLQTAGGQAINFHILFDPTPDNHIEEIERALGLLKYTFNENPYSCTVSDLTRLGAAYDAKQTDQYGQLKTGANQFKPNFDKVVNWLNNDAGTWIRNHAIFGVSNGSDGVSGLRETSGLGAERENIQTKADLIFSGKPADRKYYLNQGSPKPCVHGCDAQPLFEPSEQRYCWIKARPTFTGLRQILREPEDRVWIGETAPGPADLGRSIEKVSINGSSWFETGELHLNSGLIAIVGEKGSGKTALAELIADAGGAHTDRVRTGSDASFIARAGSGLQGLDVTLHWRDGHQSSSSTERETAEVRYLSQDFVEHLCSSDHQGRELIVELEGMVFRYIPAPEQLGTSSFRELREKKTSTLTYRKQVLREKIRALNRSIDGSETDIETISDTEIELSSVETEIARIMERLSELQESVSIEVVDELEALSKEVQDLEDQISSLMDKQRKVDTAEAARVSFEKHVLDQFHSLKTKLEESGLSDVEIDNFKPSFPSERIGILPTRSQELSREIRKFQGEEGFSTADFRSLTKVRSQLPAVKNAMSQDQKVRDNILQLREQIEGLQRHKNSLVNRLERLRKLSSELDIRREERKNAFIEILAILDEERKILENLYLPLTEQIGERLKKTSTKEFSVGVRRRGDWMNWLARHDILFDLRRGTNVDIGENQARKLTEALDKSDDGSALFEKIDEFAADKQVRDDQKSPRKGGSSIVDVYDWLYDTEHISVDYALRYGGVDLAKLSPGTRGIVLLLLYLVVDDKDNRPLIIDQPEGNLDNSSVAEALVPFIRKAREERQIILVSHNPNLVVVTDADQIIISSAMRPETLDHPILRYLSGAFEDIGDETSPHESTIRILEGGRTPFLQRASGYVSPE